MLRKLGFQEHDRLLIINADDFGMCHSANAAVMQMLGEGAVTSSTVMMPCAWSKEAATYYKHNRNANIGIHLTLTSEWLTYKWGPVTKGDLVSSLITDEGYFPNDSKTVEMNADPEQVRTELKNQIELGIKLGIDPTHVDNHMGSVYGLATGRDFIEVVLDLCEEYRLPFRLPRNVALAEQLPKELLEMSERTIRSADQRGVMIIDYLIGLSYHLEEGETYESFKGKMLQTLTGLKPGVSEIIIHPMLATEELKAITPHWEKRQMEYDLFREEELKQVLRDENIHLISYRQLRDLQRTDA